MGVHMCIHCMCLCEYSRVCAYAYGVLCVYGMLCGFATLHLHVSMRCIIACLLPNVHSSWSSVMSTDELNTKRSEPTH